MADRVGILVISYELLGQMLHLPEGHRIRGFRLVDTFSDTLELAIEGPSLPERFPGAQLHRLEYVVETTLDSEHLVPAQTHVGKFL